MPPDDEGFTLRGDRRRLVYKGRRRSHRFTILGDTAFEYDCILLREPESNVITLFIEGAELFDFFRQPDFIKDPLLAGSYAVYKKETLIGEGTGKLCHIHRPEIIDSRGRRCWGDLAVVGNILHITIPEQWLAEATYPVIVDPVVGTSTVGSMNSFEMNGREALMLYQFGVNSYYIPEDFTGECVANVYCGYVSSSFSVYTPKIFDNVNNKPGTLRSKNEITIQHTTSPYIQSIENTPSWKTAKFDIIDKINAGSQIWFGGYGDPFFPHFDYGGGTYYRNYPEEYCVREAEEIYDEEDDEWYIDEGEYYYLPDFPIDGFETVNNFKISWFFEYEELNKNYVRTITNGVSFSDSLKIKADYKRNIMQMVNASGISKRLQAIFRTVQEAVKFTDTHNLLATYLRTMRENGKITDTNSHEGMYYRGISEHTGAYQVIIAGWFLVTKIADKAYAVGNAFSGLLMVVRIVSKVFMRDYIIGRFLKARQELVLKSPVSREIIIESKIE